MNNDFSQFSLYCMAMKVFSKTYEIPIDILTRDSCDFSWNHQIKIRLWRTHSYGWTKNTDDRPSQSCLHRHDLHRVSHAKLTFLRKSSFSELEWRNKRYHKNAEVYFFNWNLWVILD